MRMSRERPPEEEQRPASVNGRRIWLPAQSQNYDAFLKFVETARILPLGQTAAVLMFPSKCMALRYVNKPVSCH
jgi:hypothetical protein